MIPKSDAEEGESDVEEVLVDAIGTRSCIILEYDPDPGLQLERMVVLGVDGKDPTLFYPYAMAVQPQLWIAGLTPTPVYCNNRKDLSESHAWNKYAFYFFDLLVSRSSLLYRILDNGGHKNYAGTEDRV